MKQLKDQALHIQKYYVAKALKPIIIPCPLLFSCHVIQNHEYINDRSIHMPKKTTQNKEPDNHLFQAKVEISGSVISTAFQLKVIL